jgi:hypothetical protein
MKSKNIKEIRHGYLLFAVGMCCSIAVGFGCVWSFLLTADSEVARMEIRSGEYDVTFESQIALTERVDSLYNNIALLNSGKRMNEPVLHNRISTQKMNLIGTIASMDKRDALLYGLMSDRVNTILQMRDSIRLVSSQVEQMKGDLQRCIDDNRRATRRMIFSSPSNSR